MNLSNLLSGLIGAVIGGIFSFAGSYWTMKQQRSQTRLVASHTASSAILDNIATIKNGMYRVRQALDSGETPSFDTVHAGTWSKGLSVVPIDLNGDGRRDYFGYDPKQGTWFQVLSR